MIAFCKTGGDSGSYQIYLINNDGTGLTQLTNDGNGYTWVRFSRDANYLLAANLPGHVWIYTVGGTLVRELTNYAHGRTGYHQGDWSPDGTQIVLCNNTGGGDRSTLQVVNADDSDWFPVNLGASDAAHQMSVWTPSAILWSLDGTKFMFPIGPSSSTLASPSSAVNVRLVNKGTTTGGIIDGTTGTTLTTATAPEGVLPCRWVNDSTILALDADSSSGQNEILQRAISGGASIIYVDSGGTVLNMAHTFVAYDHSAAYVWVNNAENGIMLSDFGAPATMIYSDPGNSVSKYGLDVVLGAVTPPIEPAPGESGVVLMVEP